MSQAYANKIAIITGAASGIGLGILRHLVANGASVVLGDMNEQVGKGLEDEINAAEGRTAVRFCRVDVASWDSVVELFEFAYTAFGPRIDYVFANAGISQMREMRSSDPTHFGCAQIALDDLKASPPSLKVLDVNLNGVLYTMYAALAYFRKQERDQDGWRGKFVATGSNASFYPFPNDPLYNISKHGVLGAIRSVGPRVLEEGITANCFGPSIVATGLAPPEFIKRLASEGRITPMQTVLDAVDTFIAPSSRVTGHIIESCGTKNVFREVPTYLNGAARANMDEFWPVDEIEKALSVDGAGLETVH